MHTTLLVFVLTCTALAVQETTRLQLQVAHKLQIKHKITEKADIGGVMESIVKWSLKKKKSVFTTEKAMILNFGYTGKLPYHQLSLSSSTDHKPLTINLGTDKILGGINAPTKSSVVLVAGSALHDLEHVMYKAFVLTNDHDDYRKIALNIPYVVFLLSNDPKMILNATRYETEAPVVRLEIQGDGSLSSEFTFTCYGSSYKSSMLVLRNGQVNKRMEEICPYPQARIAFNRNPEQVDPLFFKKSYDNMYLIFKWGATTNEIVSSFLTTYNIQPTWQITNNDDENLYVVWDNQADLGVPETAYVNTISNFVDYSHSTGYSNTHWISRTPREVLATTNLLRIFDTYCWVGIIISMVSLVAFFKFAAKVGACYGLGSENSDDFLIPFRIPVPVYVPYLSNRFGWNMKLLLPRGFSFNLVLIIWGLFGGVLLHGLLSNFRKMLLKPMYEDPIDTAQDILDRGLIPILAVGEGAGETLIRVMNRSNNPAYHQLVKISVIPNNMSSLIKMLKEDVLEAGTHVYMCNDLHDQEKLGEFYWSKDILDGLSPWGGYALNKKWPLNEEMQKHLLMFQQAGLIFRNPRTWSPIIRPGEPFQIVEMKHLFIPFFVLGVGHAAAWVLFMLELVHALYKKRKSANRQLIATQQQENESQEQIEIIEENVSGNESKPDYDLIEIVD